MDCSVAIILAKTGTNYANLTDDAFADNPLDATRDSDGEERRGDEGQPALSH